MEEKLKIKPLIKGIKNLDDFHVGDIIEVGGRLELITGRDVYQLISVYRDPPKEICWGVRAIKIVDDGSLSGMRIYERLKRDSGDLAQQRIYQALGQLLNEHGITQ